MTYATLVQDMKQYLERGDIQDVDVEIQIPRLIALAEKRIATEIKPQGFERYLTGTFTAGVSVYSKPDRWRETMFLEYGVNTSQSPTGLKSRVTLLSRGLPYCRNYWPDASRVDPDNPPRFYADYGYQHILVCPTPVQNNPFEWAIWELLQPLDTQNQTNWLTQYAPSVLLYAGLLEAQLFLKNTEIVPVWQAEFDRAVAGMTVQDIRKIDDSSTKRKEGKSS